MDYQLTVQEEAFVQHYVAHKHTLHALAAAGFPTTKAAGRALLGDERIAQRVREMWSDAMTAADATPEKVMREYARIAFADIRDLYDADGEFLPMHDIDDDVAATISGIDVETRWERTGKSAVPVTTKKVRRFDKMAALAVLAKHFKIISDESDGFNLAAILAARLHEAHLRTGEVEDARMVQAPASPASPAEADPPPVQAVDPVPQPIAPPPPPAQEYDDERLW